MGLSADDPAFSLLHLNCGDDLVLNFWHINSVKGMRSGDVLVLEILTQSSVNRTAKKLLMCHGIKEQKVLGWIWTTQEEEKAENVLCSALSYYMDLVLQTDISKSIK